MFIKIHLEILTPSPDYVNAEQVHHVYSLLKPIQPKVALHVPFVPLICANPPRRAPPAILDLIKHIFAQDHFLALCRKEKKSNKYIILKMEH